MLEDPAPVLRTLGILVAPDGSIHCSLNTVHPSLHLIIVGPHTRFLSWLEFFASFTHPAAALLLSICETWHVQHLGNVQFLTPPHTSDDPPLTYH